MSTFSTVLNGQLIPVAPSTGVFPAPAPAPLVSQGSAPSTLPGAVQGAAVTQAAVAAQTGGGSAQMSTNTGANATLAGFAGNVWALPVWQNPLALTIFFLIIGYLILRAVHWSG